MDKEILKTVDEKKMLYIAGVLLFLVFLLVRIDLLAISGGMLILLGLVLETIFNIERHGWKKEALEWAKVLVVGAILLFGSSWVLQTPVPFDGIVSCSMVPNLHRGDAVIVSGIHPINTTYVDLSPEEWEVAQEEIHYVCGVCKEGDKQRPCLLDPSTGAEVNPKIVEYTCGICPYEVEGQEYGVACSLGVRVKDVYVDATRMEGDIIVYRPKEGDVFSRIGDIIHRALVGIRVGDEVYYLTKGDNNPQFDVQTFMKGETNHPVDKEMLLGKSIFRIPLLGYIKLAASGMIQTPYNCKTRIYYSNYIPAETQK